MVSNVEAVHTPFPEDEHVNAPHHVAIDPDNQENWDSQHIGSVADALHTVTTTLGRLGVQTVTFYVQNIDMGYRLDFLEKDKQATERATSEKHEPYPMVQFRSNGREEILRVTRGFLTKAALEIQETSDKERQLIREKHAAALDEETFNDHINPGTTGDVDLFIYTGNQTQLSGGLLWEGSYAEIARTPVPFTELTREEVETIVHEQYKPKNRRFGALPAETITE